MYELMQVAGNSYYLQSPAKIGLYKLSDTEINELVQALLQTGDTVRARQALDYCEEVLPGTTVPYDYTATFTADYYYQLGDMEHGDLITDTVAATCVEYLDWFFGLAPARQAQAKGSIGRQFAEFNHVLRICQDNNRTALLDKYYPKYAEYSKKMGY